ncbi:MAG: carbohydrate ABC transporter permease, partial [Armatimonadetes bacterium]|nr:carbohydrate ABC transporter permease [Armatimonadota bacterium]
MRHGAQHPTPAQAAVVYALLLLVAATTILPLVWMAGTSLKLPAAPITDFWPGTPTLENYSQVLRTTPFGRYYMNSLLTSVVITIGQVATSALAAYAFARLRFPARDGLFLSYLATMMIPQ